MKATAAHKHQSAGYEPAIIIYIIILKKWMKDFKHGIVFFGGIVLGR